MTVGNATSTVLHDWRYLSEVEVGPAELVISPRAGAPVVIPRAGFADAGEFEELERLVMERWQVRAAS